MKRALLVGIDHYENFSPLYGCANDAEAIEPLLATNEDDSPNLECRLASARDDATQIGRDDLLEMVDVLLGGGVSFALLYFAGHGRKPKAVWHWPPPMAPPPLPACSSPRS